MTSTLAPPPQARPKSASRPPGRPTDAAVRAFEIAIEAICAIEADEEALGHAFAGLQHIRSIGVRLEDVIRARVRRLQDVVKPEIQGAMIGADRHLVAATRQRNAR